MNFQCGEILTSLPDWSVYSKTILLDRPFGALHDHPGAGFDADDCHAKFSPGTVQFIDRVDGDILGDGQTTPCPDEVLAYKIDLVLVFFQSISPNSLGVKISLN